MRAMAEKDWMEDIRFLCRLSGSTMNRETAISSSTRKPPVTCTPHQRALWEIYTENKAVGTALLIGLLIRLILEGRAVRDTQMPP